MAFIYGSGSSSASDGDDIELYQKVLLFTGDNSRDGQRQITRDDYSRNLRKYFGSVTFTQLKNALVRLATDGLLEIEPVSPDDFRVSVTIAGFEYIRRFEDGEPMSAIGGKGPEAKEASSPSETPPAKELTPNTEVETPSRPPDSKEASASNQLGTEGDLPTFKDFSEGAGAQEEQAASQSNGTSAAATPPDRERISDLMKSLEATLAKEKIQDSAAMAPGKPSPNQSGRDQMAMEERELLNAREELARKEKALRDRIMSNLVQRDAELALREKELAGRLESMDKGLTEKRVGVEKLTEYLRTRQAKMDEREKVLAKREKDFEERLSSLDEMEGALSAQLSSMLEHEASMEELEKKRAAMREGLRKSHAELSERLKKHSTTAGSQVGEQNASD